MSAHRESLPPRFRQLASGEIVKVQSVGDVHEIGKRPSASRANLGSFAVKTLVAFNLFGIPIAALTGQPGIVDDYKELPNNVMTGAQTVVDGVTNTAGLVMKIKKVAS